MIPGRDALDLLGLPRSRNLRSDIPASGCADLSEGEYLRGLSKSKKKSLKIRFFSAAEAFDAAVKAKDLDFAYEMLSEMAALSTALSQDKEVILRYREAEEDLYQHLGSLKVLYSGILDLEVIETPIPNKEEKISLNPPVLDSNPPPVSKFVPYTCQFSMIVGMPRRDNYPIKEAVIYRPIFFHHLFGLVEAKFWSKPFYKHLYLVVTPFISLGYRLIQRGRYEVGYNTKLLNETYNAVMGYESDKNRLESDGVRELEPDRVFKLLSVLFLQR